MIIEIRLREGHDVVQNTEWKKMFACRIEEDSIADSLFNTFCRCAQQWQLDLVMKKERDVHAQDRQEGC